FGSLKGFLLRDFLEATQECLIEGAVGIRLTFQLTEPDTGGLVLLNATLELFKARLQRLLARERHIIVVANIRNDAIDFQVDLALDVSALGAYIDHLRMA